MSFNFFSFMKLICLYFFNDYYFYCLVSLQVVLSACSSYFQTLFLDHPARHPIVILKDVQYPELRTLVEFMYKGEVNVQYCQLSALLKTAESLKVSKALNELHKIEFRVKFLDYESTFIKRVSFINNSQVKGLAEMTNQNTALREPEREPERLRPHSIPSKSESLENAASTIKSSVTTTTTTSSSLSLQMRLDNERNSPTSPPRLQTPHSPTTPLALYQKKLTNRDREHHSHESSGATATSTRISPHHNDSPFIPKEERASSPDDDGMSNDVGELDFFSYFYFHSVTNSTSNRKMFLFLNSGNSHLRFLGLNMSLNAIHSAPPSTVIPQISTVSSLTSDLRPSSRGGGGGIGSGGGGVGGTGGNGAGSSSVGHSSITFGNNGNNGRDIGTGGSGLPSPMSEPIPGPSGMGPVQQVPLVCFFSKQSTIYTFLIITQNISIFSLSKKKSIGIAMTKNFLELVKVAVRIFVIRMIR